MKKTGLISIAFLLVIFSGCKPSRDKLTTEILSFETTMYSPAATTFNKENADQLIKLYDRFVKEYPADSLAPVYLFKSANLEMNASDPTSAIQRFDQLIREYPADSKVPTSQFFKGFIYENTLKDLEKAKEAYLLFIEKYPNNELVKDARMSIQNLGKTPEQMIKEFEMMQKHDSVRKADSIANIRGKKSNRKA